MPTPADILLIQTLQNRGALSPDQAAAILAASGDATGTADPACIDRLLERGCVNRDFAEGWRAAQEHSTLPAAEPRDLEGRLLLDAALSPRDLARVKRVRSEVKKLAPDHVPSVGQVILSAGLMRRESLEKYLEGPTSPSGGGDPSGAGDAQPASAGEPVAENSPAAGNPGATSPGSPATIPPPTEAPAVAPEAAVVVPSESVPLPVDTTRIESASPVSIPVVPVGAPIPVDTAPVDPAFAPAVPIEPALNLAPLPPAPTVASEPPLELAPSSPAPALPSEPPLELAPSAPRVVPEPPLELVPLAPVPPTAGIEKPDYESLLARLESPQDPPTKSAPPKAAPDSTPTPGPAGRKTQRPIAPGARPAGVAAPPAGKIVRPSAAPTAADAPRVAVPESPADPPLPRQPRKPTPIRPRASARLTPVATPGGASGPVEPLQLVVDPDLPTPAPPFVDGLPMAPTEEYGDCGICRSRIAPGAITKSCETCGSVYHKECWTPLTGCPQATCKRLRSSIDERVILTGPSAAVAWMKHYLWIVLSTLAGVGLAGYSITFFFHDAAWYYRKSVEARAGAIVEQKVARALDPTRGIAVDERPDGKPVDNDVRERVKRQVGYLRDALKLDPEMVAAWLDLGGAGVELADDALAREGFETVARLDPTNGLVRMALGVLEERRGDFDAAERWYREAVTLAPEEVDGWRRFARHLDLRRPEKLAEAVAAYAKAVTLVPDDRETRVRKALAELRLQGPEASIPALEAVRAESPERTDVPLALAQAYFAVGRVRDAVQLAGDLTTGNPDNLDARLVWAAALSADGRPLETIEALQPAIVPDQSRGEVFRRIAEAQAALWQLDPALENARRAVDLERSPVARLAHARILALAGRWSESLGHLDALEKEAPGSPGVELLRAEVLLVLRETERAEASIARLPDGSDKDRLMLRLLRTQGRALEAESRAVALLTGGKAAGALWTEAGHVALEAGHPARALDRFRAGERERDPHAVFGTALAWRRIGEPLRAACAYSAYVESVPAGPWAEEARKYLAETFPRPSAAQFRLLRRILDAHHRLAVPPRGRAAALRRVGDLLLELRLVSLAFVSDLPFPEEDLRLLERRAASAAREEAAPAGGRGGETELAEVAPAWVDAFPPSLDAIGLAARQRDPDSALGREVLRIMVDLASRLGTQEKTFEKLESVWAVTPEIIRPWAVLLPGSSQASLRLEEIERKRLEEDLNRFDVIEGVAGRSWAFAESLLALLEGSGARGEAACAERLRLRGRLAEAAAADAAEQICVSLTLACEVLQILGGVPDNGW